MSAVWQPGQFVRAFTDAELMAASRLRELGFHDARVTPVGADGGIDVLATGALAQVKMESTLIGRPAIQQLVGAAGRNSEDELIFFSATNFTNHAIAYSDYNVISLFTYDVLGELTPVNGVAQALLESRQSSAPTLLSLEEIEHQEYLKKQTALENYNRKWDDYLDTFTDKANYLRALVKKYHSENDKFNLFITIAQLESALAKRVLTGAGYEEPRLALANFNGTQTEFVAFSSLNFLKDVTFYFARRPFEVEYNMPDDDELTDLINEALRNLPQKGTTAYYRSLADAASKPLRKSKIDLIASFLNGKSGRTVNEKNGRRAEDRLNLLASGISQIVGYESATKVIIIITRLGDEDFPSSNERLSFADSHDISVIQVDAINGICIGKNQLGMELLSRVPKEYRSFPSVES